jgi:hypothetical protein
MACVASTVGVKFQLPALLDFVNGSSTAEFAADAEAVEEEAGPSASLRSGRDDESGNIDDAAVAEADDVEIAEAEADPSASLRDDGA